MVVKKMTHYRWVVASLVFFITLINFIDRSAVSFVKGELKKEFNFSDTQFGLILAAFALGYILLTAFGGWLVDVKGPRKIWPLSAITWSLCVGCLGFAGGFWSFILIRFLLGVTEGPHFPALTRTIGDWLPQKERARALSLGLMAIPISSVIGAPITSYLVSDFGWRQMFFVISSIGIVWAIIWYKFFTDSPQDNHRVGQAEKDLIKASSIKRDVPNDKKIDWRFILTNRVLIANNIAYFAFGYMMFFATLWLPGYFLDIHKLNLKSVGWYLTIPWLVAALFLKLGGVISDWLYQKTGSIRTARSHLIWVCQLLSAVFFLCLAKVESLEMSIFLLSLSLGFGFMPQSAFFSVNIDVAKERAASAQGITSSCLSLGGVVAPSITGWLVDKTGAYEAPFSLMAVITILSVVVVILFHKPDAPSKEAK
ncbi:MAG: MFS transporter [Rhabdochlamydiaceae bacterium]